MPSKHIEDNVKKSLLETTPNFLATLILHYYYFYIRDIFPEQGTPSPWSLAEYCILVWGVGGTATDNITYIITCRQKAQGSLPLQPKPSSL